MNVCVLGIGGVGGYYAALLTRYLNETGNGHMCFLARGRHKDAIVEKGLLLKREGGREDISVRPYLCSDSVDDLPVLDLVVVSVKGYDLENATREVSKKIHEHSIVLPLLNGADIYDRMRHHLRKGYLLPSCLYLSSYIESPGVVFQKGGSGQISIGRDPLHPDFYPERLMSLFRNAGIRIEFFEDVNIEIWTKYIFIASFALVTATYDQTIGEVAHDGKLAMLVKNIMQEMASVARALKVKLPPDIVDTSFSKAGQFPFETKTSFQRDVETKGRRSEWDLFGGTVLRYAERFHIAADHTRETLDRLLRDLQ